MLKLGAWVVAGVVCALSPALAQNKPLTGSLGGFQASLPLEVAMLYYHTAKLAPPLGAWAKQSPAVKNVGEGFGAEAVIAQEKQQLSQLYKKIVQQKTIFYTQSLVIDPDQSGPEQIVFKGLDPDTPVMFEDLNQSYALFVRNFDDYTQLKAPFEFMNAPSITQALNQNQPLQAEIVFKPVAADKMPLNLGNGTVAQMMLVDVVEVSLLDNTQNVVLQKRYQGWQKPSDLKNLFGGSAPLSGTPTEDKTAVIPQAADKN